MLFDIPNCKIISLYVENLGLDFGKDTQRTWTKAVLKNFKKIQI